MNCPQCGKEVPEAKLSLFIDMLADALERADGAKYDDPMANALFRGSVSVALKWASGMCGGCITDSVIGDLRRA